MSIVIGAIVVGSSVIVHAGAGPRFMDIPVLALLGFVLGSALTVWLIFSDLLSR
jgi:ubiquinone biosynthesis protein